jgi:hypothetical protein
LEIARGVLAGGAVRAVPVLPPAQASGDGTAAFGARPPSPLAALVQATIDKQKEPVCTGEPTGSGSGTTTTTTPAPEPDGLGLTGTEATLEALAHGSDLQRAFESALAEMLREKFCDRLKELIEELSRAYRLVKDPALVSDITTAQAKLEGRDLKSLTPAEYHQLRPRAIRAYVVGAAWSELDLRSGGAVANGETTFVGHAAHGDRPTDRTLEDIQARGDIRTDVAP